MKDTASRMRSLADAVPGTGGGVRFQPIFPETLRTWAREIDGLRDALRHIAEYGDLCSARMIAARALDPTLPPIVEEE